MKRSNLILLFIAVLALLAFVPKAEEPIERLVSSLQKWVDKNPLEKVYLHMDKPYYALGDTVWFKAYVTIGSRHQLSKMSGALYVELIDEKDSLLSAVKLPLVAGMALGDFTLGDNYKAGNFRIRAYTQWMRNAGEEYFFDKSFVVGDPLGLTAAEGLKGNGAGSNQKAANGIAGQAVAGRALSDTKGQALTLNTSDVQFFPEGGSLVNGINSRMGFKAVAASGRGIAIKGVVKDNAGVEVSNFETLHAGMGVFNFRPEAGKNYKAKVTFSDGSEKLIDLPKALEQGYVLSVYQPGPDSVLVRINASPAQYQIPYAVDLMVHSGGEVVSATTVKINKAVNSVWLMKKDFPSGIAQFTLFDGRGEAVNERIAFVRAKDRMQLTLNSAKKSYKSRERVELDMEARDKSGKPVAGNFSVSVIDESKTPADENAETTIFSSMLLSSDVKGYIEQPNYYFRKDTAEVNKALDNLMLTQGYRRFVWKDILSTTSEGAAPRYPAESLGTEISGRVVTLSGKPVVNGQVTVMSLTPGFIEQAKTDADGRFKYLPIMLADSLRFAVQARTEKKSNKVEVILDSIPRQVIGKNWNIPGFTTNIEESTIVYLDNSRKQDELLVRTGGQGRVNRLKEVAITAKRLESEQYVSQGGYSIPEGHADQTFKIRNGETCSNLGNCLVGMLQGVSFMPFEQVPLYPYARDPRLETFEKLPMQVIVNGRKIEGSELEDIFNNNVLDPADILKIDVVTTNALVVMLGKPSLLIYTNKSYSRNKRYNPAIANIKPKGFNKAREFYAPRYDRPNISQQLPDLRSTIYWNPKLKTDSNGRGSFSYFNADGPGSYKVIVEGINAAGELARQVYRYEVGGTGTQVTLPEIPSGKTAELVKAVQGFQQRLPAEKLYIHMDKPYYNIGDTLWFKAYLFDATTFAPSKRSGFLYIELNDDTAEAVRRINVPVKDGVAYAQIPLLRKIFHEGGYTLRAYTNWMQNFGDDYFFTQRFYLGVPTGDTWLVQSNSKISRVAEKDELQASIELIRSDRTAAGLRDVEVRLMEGSNELYKQNLQTSNEGKLDLKYELKEKADGRNIRLEVVSLHPNDGGQRLQIPLNIKRNQLIDLQFLPEGGNLVAGLKSLVAFKALSEDGKGTDVSGEIYDSKGTMVKAFNSLYKGMGSFEFTPVAGEKYTAKLLQPEATGKPYVLPIVKSEGAVLHVVNNEQETKLFINIEASPAAIHKDSTYYLLGTSRGMVTYSKEITGDQKSFSIAKDLFSSGITRFTLLRGKTPLNERIVFIDHQDNLKFSVKTNKASYGKRENVGLSMTVTDKNGAPVKGRFSLAVTDDSQVKADSAGQHSMLASLLLSSDLKGQVETPGYYLNSANKDRWQAMDNLMLTQGWTGYNWKDVFSAPKPPEYKAEQHLRIAGKVTNILNKPVAGAQMLISSQKPVFISTTITDDKGKYVFENLPQIDSGSFFIQAKTPKGKSMNFGGVTVEKFKSAMIEFNFRDQQLPWYVNSEVTQLNYVKNAVAKSKESGLKQTGIALKEVKIVSKKIIKESYNRFGPGNADLVFDEQDIKESGTMSLYELLRQKIPGLRVVYDEQEPALMIGDRLAAIIIDGGGMPLEIDTTERVTTDILIDALSQYKVATLTGVEVLYSKKYMYRYFSRNASGPDIYIPPFRPENFLDFRVNGPNRKMREHAVIELTTTNKRGWHINRRPDYATYRPLPLMQSQEFYSPKYTAQSKDAAEPDFRSTIFWAPDVQTDQNGNAEVSFYSSDISGSYSINVQGADRDGNIGGTHLKINTKGKQVTAEQAVVVPKATATELPTGKSAEIVKAVQGLQQRKPVEKLYLHTDKSYYNLGDTLWFKVYLLDAVGLSASKRSGLLYVELNDDSAETVRRISIPIKNGEGWAQIPLSSKILHEGCYTLRAYTNWMQNFGEDHFFTRRFYLGVPDRKTWLAQTSVKVSEAGELAADVILSKLDKSAVALRDVEVRIIEADRELHKEKMQTGSDGQLHLKYPLEPTADGKNLRVEIRSLQPNDGKQWLKIPLNVSREGQIDLQFLPEGGHLVAGLGSVVGFKAVGEDGKGINVTGLVRDSKGLVVVDFKSFYNGMGSFVLKPRVAEEYMAELKLADGSTRTFALPVAAVQGTTLSIINKKENESLEIRIDATEDVKRTDSTWYLIGTSRGGVNYVKTVDFNQDTYEVPKNLFFTGIARFTLLKGTLPVNERITFIDHQDQLSAVLKTQKTAYKQRDSVSLEIEVKDQHGSPVKGSFSIAVTDDSQVKPDSTGNMDMATDLLFASDLKGTIENPGYYLNNKTQQSWQALDQLLLTQGWVGFDWKEVFESPKPLKYEAEKYLKVSGTVTNILKKPVKGTQVLLSSQKPAFITTGLTDENGRYLFENLPAIDSGAFFIQARTPKGGAMSFGGVTVNKFTPAPVVTNYRNQIMPWYVNTDPAQLNYVAKSAEIPGQGYFPMDGISLKEVAIKGRKSIPGSWNPNGAGNADIVLDEKDIKESGTMNLYDLLKQKLPGVRVVSEDGFPTVKMNNYLIDINIDGQELPLRMNSGPTVEELKTELTDFKIISFTGLEVMYSRKYTNRFYEFNKPNNRTQTSSIPTGIDDPRFELMASGSNTYLAERARLPTKIPVEVAKIVITTKHRNGWYKISKADVASYRPVPFMQAKEFYSPKYKTAAVNAAIPDYRPTVFWKPNVNTNASGKAVVSFYTSDQNGTYSVNLQGTNMDGSIGSAKTQLKVSL